MSITPLVGSDTFETWFNSTNSIINLVNGLTNGYDILGSTGIDVSISSGKTATISNTGVLSFNGSTGNIFGVISINGLSGIVGISAGDNITITQSGNTFTINSSGGAPGSGINSVNAGIGISVSVGTNPIVSNTGVLTINGLSGSILAVNTFNGLTGAVTGVASFNGLTGAVSGVTTSVINNFIELQRFSSGISAAGATLSERLNVSGTSTFTGSANFNAGITTGNIRGSLQTFSTTSSTVNLFTSPTTSIILGNIATDVNLGHTAGTGSTTIKNNLIAGSTLSNTILLPSGQRIKTYSATTTSTSTFTLISESIDTSGFATADITIQASRGTTTTDASEMVKFAVCAYCDGLDTAVVNHVQYANVYSGSSGNSIATYTVFTSSESPVWSIRITPNSTTSTRFRATVILGPSIGSCALNP